MSIKIAASDAANALEVMGAMFERRAEQFDAFNKTLGGPQNTTASEVWRLAAKMCRDADVIECDRPIVGNEREEYETVVQRRDALRIALNKSHTREEELEAEVKKLRRNLNDMREYASEGERLLEAPTSLGYYAAVPEVSLIVEERIKQIIRHGYDQSHDDKHADFTLVEAAIAYLSYVATGDLTFAPETWPLDEPFLPEELPMKNMMKAAALVLAAMEAYRRRYLRDVK